jgi:putative endonuclease
MCNNMLRRTWEHKLGNIEGFTKRYRIDRLVYYERFQYVNNAINREKELKRWSRAKKIALIKTQNPTWLDLSEVWYDEMQIPRRLAPRDDNALRTVDREFGLKSQVTQTKGETD